jgi:hypothetical protein
MLAVVVRTAIGPVDASDGTFTSTRVDPTATIAAGAPPNETSRVSLRFAPITTTVVPGAPLGGSNRESAVAAGVAAAQVVTNATVASAAQTLETATSAD